MRVAIDAHAATGRDGRALGVLDARVDVAAGGLALAGEHDGLVRLDRPVEIELEVGEFGGELRGIGEAGAIVFGGVARDAAGLLDRVADRRRREVGGAGGTLAGAEVDGDADAAVALVFDRLDLAEAHGGVEAPLQAGVGLGLGGAAATGLLERERDDGLEFGDAAGVDGS